MTTPDREMSQAADHVRAFNHATINTGQDWQFPPHSYRAVGQLAHLIRMLPQAIEQSALPAQHTHRLGRLLIDGGNDAHRAVQHLQQTLDAAVQAAEQLAQAIDRVHAATAPMGLDTQGLPGFDD